MNTLTRRKLLKLFLATTAVVVLPVRWTIRKVRGSVSRKEASFYRKLMVAGVCLLPLALSPSTVSAKTVFEPVVAGKFYPADAAKVREMVQSYIDNAGNPSVKGELLGLIAPHAGYVYSGPVAGHAYKELKGRAYDIVVVIAPSHTSPLNGVSILNVDAYRTPLGDVPVNREAVRALIDGIPWISHVPALFSREHSMEVHLPFLQVALKPGFTIVPVVMGSSNPDLAAAFATVLARQFRGHKVLFVASSDMSHYLPYDGARKKDNGTLKIIGNGEIDTLFRQCSTRESELCGLGPVQVVMHLAEKMGIEGGTLLKYANSGDTAGDRSRVVGYSSFAFENPEEHLTVTDKQTLLTLARQTLEQYVRTGKRPVVVPGSPALPNSQALIEPGAAFVTLKRRGELRGCIGQLRPTMPLYRSVLEMAVSSCSRDRRFTPVKPEELGEIHVEVSVMSPFMKVAGIDEIEVGRDGLYLTYQGRSGVLLPQVPGEQGWDKGAYLKAICRKAGLPDRSWEKAGAKLYRFTAQVFSE